MIPHISVNWSEEVFRQILDVEALFHFPFLQNQKFLYFLWLKFILTYENKELKAYHLERRQAAGQDSFLEPDLLFLEADKLHIDTYF